MAVDESIMPWKGIVGFRQYIPSKPTKYRIKMYFFCEAGSGYISRLKIYVGKEGDYGGNVVRELVEDFHVQGPPFFPLFFFFLSFFFFFSFFSFFSLA